MQTLQDKLANYDIKEALKHPRFKFIDFIFQKINYERLRDRQKPWSKQLIAIKTSHCSLEDLDYLCKRVGQSSNPARTFWGAIKVKKD